MIHRAIRYFSRWEKIFLIVFTTIFFLSGGGIIYAFWVDNTNIQPAQGGQFTEGAIGKIDEKFAMNPLLIFGKKSNSLEADLNQLVFAGLMRFNPETGKHEDYLADHTLSEDKIIYTFKLKDGIKWHDGTPMTADDLLFTFRDVIQHPQFKNEFLKSAFDGVEIQKIDDRTVTFRLQQPYKFFLNNFTVGIVPKHLLQSLPVDNMELDISFNQSPIGAGPYKFDRISIEDARFAEIRLSRFESFALDKPLIDTVNIRVFSTINDLVTNINDLDGIRPILKNDSEILPIGERLQTQDFHLPQYVAAFINMDQSIFSGEAGQKMRWALQLATNKDELLKEIPGLRIDTPLLELDMESWLSEYDFEKASGGLKDAGWYLPGTYNADEEEVGETDSETAEELSSSENPTVESETNDPDSTASVDPSTETAEHNAPSDQWINDPTTDESYTTTNTDFYVSGVVPEGTQIVKVNNYQLQLFDPAVNSWSYKASTNIGTMKYGSNIYSAVFYDSNGQEISNDKITIYLVTEMPEPEPAEENPIAEEPAPEEEIMPNPEEVTGESEENAGDNASNENESVLEGDIEEISEESIEDPSASEEDLSVEDDPSLPPLRVSADGKKLELSLITASSPAYYQKVAKILKNQWRQVGIDLKVEILDTSDLVTRIESRDYNILLYGQNLGYNPDAFGYWHLSQAKTGLNLSEYKSFAASVLLEEIRRTHDEDLRYESLKKLQKIIIDDVPAVFLFSPDYVLIMDQKKVKNVSIRRMAFFPDRFTNIDKWHIRSERTFKEDAGWLSIFKWSWKQIFN